MKLPKINMSGVSKVAKSVLTFASDNAPEILLISGTVGLVGAVVETTVHATPKAVEAINEAEEEKGEDLTKTEVIKETWVYYIPTILMVGGSVTAIVASYLITRKRTTALVAACALATETATQYKDDIIGQFSDEDVKKATSDSGYEKMVKGWSNANWESTGLGVTPCYDAVFGRYFFCDGNIIKETFDILDKQLTRADPFSDATRCVTDYYEKINLETTELTDCIGWRQNPERPTERVIHYDLDSRVAPDGVTPCLVISYNWETIIP